MKRKSFLLRLATAFVALTALIGTACVQSVGGDDDGTVSGDGSSTRMVTISVAGTTSGSSASRAVSRTILPDMTNLGGFSSLKLTGTSARGTTVSEDLTGKLTAEGETAQVELAATYWELILTASKDGKEILRGRQAVDLTNGSQSITFTLGAGDLTTNGTVNITGTYVFHTGVAKYTVGLYQLNTTAETAVSGYEDTVTVSGASDETATAFSFDKSSAYSCPPGEYLFALKLLDSSDNELMMYSDLVIVHPGLCTTASITIADYMTQAPAAPKNFTAELIESSASQSDTDGFYNVVFKWKDNSENEKYFELVLTEYESDGTTEKAHQTFPIGATGDASLAKYVAGSLSAGNETYTLRLPTGRLFDATLKAKTSKGATVYASDSVSRSAVTTASTGYKGYTAATKINLVRRVYDLNGGTLTLGSKNYTGTYYEFSVYDGTNDIPLLAIASPTTLKKTVGAANYSWTEWIDTATNTTATAPAGCTDGSYKAKYPSGTVGYTILGYSDLSASNVTVTGTGVDGTPSSGTVTVKISEKITLEITDTTYTSYSFIIGDKTIDCGSASSYSFTPSASFDASSYLAAAIATASDGTKYSCTFVLKIVK